MAICVIETPGFIFSRLFFLSFFCLFFSSSRVRKGCTTTVSWIFFLEIGIGMRKRDFRETNDERNTYRKYKSAYYDISCANTRHTLAVPANTSGDTGGVAEKAEYRMERSRYKFYFAIDRPVIFGGTERTSTRNEPTNTLACRVT